MMNEQSKQKMRLVVNGAVSIYEEENWQIQRHGFHVCGSASSQAKPLTATHEKVLLCGDTRLPTPASRRGSPRRCVCASAGAGLSTLRAQQRLRKGKSG